jgi:hypothetical protein
MQKRFTKLQINTNEGRRFPGNKSFLRWLLGMIPAIMCAPEIWVPSLWVGLGTLLTRFLTQDISSWI